MLTKRDLLLRAGSFLLLLALLLYPWPLVGRLFVQAFDVAANIGVAAALNDPEAQAHFAAADVAASDEPSAGEWNTVLSIQRGASDALTTISLGVRRLGYVPLATFVALVLVTPVERRRKLAIGTVGISLLLLRLSLAVALPLARAFGTLANDSPGGWLASVLYYSLIEPPNLMYAAPVVTWAVLVLFAAPPIALSAKGFPEASPPHPTR